MTTASMASPTTWVVKIGGSLYDAPEFGEWLAALARRGFVTVVPGGGLFADAVRAMQARWRFDDRDAHSMALAGMRQAARMLTAVEPALRILRSQLEVSDQLRSGAASVWMPDETELEAAGIPPTWEVTSDSLAAWLARSVAADRLGFVKSVAGLTGELAIEAASERNWLDSAVPRYWRRAMPAWLFSGRQLHNPIDALAYPERWGMRLL